MSKEIEYAVRVSKIENSGKPQVHITFGPKSHVDKKFNAVEITSFPGKMFFRFFVKGENENFRKGTSLFAKETSKKLTLYRPNSNLARAVIGDVNFMNEFDGFEGEYSDMCFDTKYELNDKIKNELHCWINLSAKESYTNMYKNSSATVKPAKKPDISKNNSTEVIKQIIDDEYEHLEEIREEQAYKVKVRNYVDNFKNDVERETALCEDIVDEAKTCTEKMAAVVDKLIHFRLITRQLSIGEADANAEFLKIVSKYVRLQKAIEDLMYNVRFTWEDGRSTYNAYKKIKEDNPEKTDEEIAEMLMMPVKELFETKKANEKIAEETTNKIKPGFAP